MFLKKLLLTPLIVLIIGNIGCNNLTAKDARSEAFNALRKEILLDIEYYSKSGRCSFEDFYPNWNSSLEIELKSYGYKVTNEGNGHIWISWCD